MKTRDTILGLVVLGLVLAGVYWARGRNQFPSPADGPGPRAGGSPALTDAALPDVTFGDGIVELGDVKVTLSVVPRPPVALAQMQVRVLAQKGAAPVTLDGGRVTFEMAMPMGDQRYALAATADGWQEANVVLPLCPSGNRRWYAIVEGTVAGQPAAARFRLDLTKPGSPPAP